MKGKKRKNKSKGPGGNQRGGKTIFTSISIVRPKSPSEKTKDKRGKKVCKAGPGDNWGGKGKGGQ